jgi:hypothetical protein
MRTTNILKTKVRGSIRFDGFRRENGHVGIRYHVICHSLARFGQLARVDVERALSENTSLQRRLT